MYVYGNRYFDCKLISIYFIELVNIITLFVNTFIVHILFKRWLAYFTSGCLILSMAISSNITLYQWIFVSIKEHLILLMNILIYH